MGANRDVYDVAAAFFPNLITEVVQDNPGIPVGEWRDDKRFSKLAHGVKSTSKSVFDARVNESGK